MAVYAGATGLYKTAAGWVPAVTTAHYSSGVVADVAAPSATTVDIITLGYQPTRVAGVTVTTSNFTNRNSVTTGQFWVAS